MSTTTQNIIIQALTMRFFDDPDLEHSIRSGSGSFCNIHCLTLPPWHLVINPRQESASLVEHFGPRFPELREFGDRATPWQVKFPPLSVTVLRGAKPVLCAGWEWYVGDISIADELFVIMQNQIGELADAQPDTLLARYSAGEATADEERITRTYLKQLLDDTPDEPPSAGNVLEHMATLALERHGQERLFL